MLPQIRAVVERFGDTNCTPSIANVCPHNELINFVTLRLLAHSQTFNVSEITFIDRQGYGRAENGSWIGGWFGYVFDGKSDLAVGTFSHQPDRDEHFTFSDTIAFENPTFVVPTPKVDTVATATEILLIFRPKLTFMLVLTLTSLCCMLGVLSRTGSLLIWPRFDLQPEDGKQNWAFFAHFLQQKTTNTRNLPLSFSILLLTIGLLSLISLNLYQSYLLTMIVSPVFSHPLVTSIDELIHKISIGDLKLVLYSPGNSYHLNILEGETDQMQRLRSALFNDMNESRLIFEPNTKRRRELLLSGGYVELQDRAFAYPMAEHNCQLMLLDATGFTNRPAAFIFAKNVSRPMLMAFNEAIRRNLAQLQSSYDKANDRYLQTIEKCAQDDATFGSPLRILSVAGAIVIHLAGLASGIVILFTEVLAYHVHVMSYVI